MFDHNELFYEKLALNFLPIEEQEEDDEDAE